MRTNKTVAEIWSSHITETGGYRFRDGEVFAAARVLSRSELWKRALKPYLRPESRVLETGIGSGQWLVAVGPRVRGLHGVDYSELVLQRVATQARRKPNLRNLRLIRADIERLPYDAGRFDVVYSEGVIEHWLDRKHRLSVLREMRRMVAKGGHLCIVVPNGKHPLIARWEATNYPGYFGPRSVPFHRYDPSELSSELRESGLSVVDSGGCHALESFAFWPRSTMKAWCSRALSRIVWLPKTFRSRWGLYSYAVGRQESV